MNTELLVNLDTLETIEADVYKLRGRGLPEGYVTAESVTPQQWIEACQRCGGCVTLGPTEGVRLIARERRRQVEEECWTAEHDDQHTDGALASVAGCLAFDHYAVGGHDRWGLVKKHRGNRLRQLQIAGALIAAEIDRLLRLPVNEKVKA